MKLLKRLAVICAVALVVSFAGLQRLNHLSSRPIDLDEFSWFNKVEIYTAYLAMNILGAPLYPEIAKEASLMLLPSSEGKEMMFESDFFLKSGFIQNTIENYTDPVALYWAWDSYMNTGTLSIEEGKVQVSVPCTWPKDAWIYLLDVPWLPQIKVQEGLFWVLEQEGWIYPYTAVWEADLTKEAA